MGDTLKQNTSSRIKFTLTGGKRCLCQVQIQYARIMLLGFVSFSSVPVSDFQ